MFNRYNIAILPNDKDFYRNLSVKYYNLSDYRVGDTSIPHITIAQFYTENKKQIKYIQNEVTKLSKNYYEIPLLVDKTFSKTEKEYSWLELRLNDDKICKDLHNTVKCILNNLNIDCINLPYIPHLTISKIISDLNLINNFIDLNIYKKDIYTIKIGFSDNLGQLVSIL